MEKQKLSGKTILKLVGALLALAYLGFCLYAGITGKFPNMHKAEHVMRFGVRQQRTAGQQGKAALDLKMGARCVDEQDVKEEQAQKAQQPQHRVGCRPPGR